MYIKYFTFISSESKVENIRFVNLLIDDVNDSTDDLPLIPPPPPSLGAIKLKEHS